MKKNVCLIGGTGLIGSLLLSELQKDSSIGKIYFLGRRPPKNLSKVEFQKMEISELLTLKPITADHWFCCLGTTIKTAGSQEAFRKVDFQAVIDFGKLAETSNAQSIHIVSALGSDENSKVFYNKTKGQMERHTMQLQIPSINFYRPSLLLGEREDFRIGEKIAILMTPILKPLLIGPLKKFTPIEAKKVALSMLDSTKIPSAGINFIENQDML